MTDKKFRENRIALIIAVATVILIIVAIALFFAVKGGAFAKDPEVDIKANNNYDKTLTVVMGNDFAPFSFKDGNEYKGHDVELANELANRLHMNAKLEYYSWTECLKKIQSGQADIIMSADYELAIDGVTYSVPTASNLWMAFGSGEIKNYADLYNKRIGIGAGTDPLKGTRLEKNCKGFKSYDMAFKALHEGRVDTVIAQYAVGAYICNQRGYRDIDAKCGVTAGHLAIGVRADDKGLERQVNDAVVHMSEDGTLEKLNNKWCGSFVRHYSLREQWRNNPEWFLGAGIILIIVFALLFLLIRRYMFARKEALIREHMQEQMELMRHLIKEYRNVYYVRTGRDKSEDRTERLFTGVVSVSDTAFPDEGLSFTEKLDTFIRDRVHQDDRERVFRETRREVVLKNLMGEDIYMVPARVIYGEKLHYGQIRFAKVGNGINTQGFVVGLRMMDDEVILRKQLREAKAKAEEASAAKSQLLMTMCHDIRSLMNPIIGFTNIGQQHYENPMQVKKSFKKIQLSANHLLGMLNDIIEMSSIESGSLTLTEKPGDIRELIDELQEINQAMAFTKGVRYKSCIGEIIDPYVHIDAAHVNEVIINLISNAVKYTEPGGKVEFRVEQIRKAQAGFASFRFVVRDTGIGIAPELQDKMFDYFARDNDRKDSGGAFAHEGAGLELSIVKKIVELHGGTIDVESRPREGSAFTVVLPLKLLTAEEKKAFLEKDTPTKDALKGQRILLVEDNEINREIASDILREAGAEIEIAADGHTAVKMVEKKGVYYYDCILMDIQMPGMNGYEACRAIRNIKNGDEVPIIAVSANAFAEDVARSLDSGMDAHVSKPIDIELLIKTMYSLRK